MIFPAERDACAGNQRHAARHMGKLAGDPIGLAAGEFEGVLERFFSTAQSRLTRRWRVHLTIRRRALGLSFTLTFHRPALSIFKARDHNAPTPLSAGCLFSTHGLAFIVYLASLVGTRTHHKAYILSAATRANSRHSTTRQGSSRNECNQNRIPGPARIPWL